MVAQATIIPIAKLFPEGPMGTILAVIAVLFVVLIVGVLGYAATKPGAFRVDRATEIKAPQEKVYRLIDDFHHWEVWSPWEKLDPTMKKTFSGAPSGTGAGYAWEGNGKVGVGRMEITNAASPSRVTIKLDFLKPFEAHNTAEFTLEPKGDSTKVTWAMHGTQPFMAKVMSVVINMDKMIGKDFETGLANMKAAAEA